MNFADLAIRLKPTGDYPPFLGLVNRFIERSFEFGKHRIHPCETSNLRSTDTIQPMGLLRFVGWGLCVGYSTVPMFWIVIHPNVEHWRARKQQGRAAYKALLPPLDWDVAGDGRNHLAVAICLGLAELSGVDSGRVVALCRSVPLCAGATRILSVAVERTT